MAIGIVQLPSGTDFDGCAVHDHCLTCPLARCVFEEGGATAEKQARTADRNEGILQWSREGQSVQDIMRRFGVSYRTVLRVRAAAGAVPRRRPE